MSLGLSTMPAEATPPPVAAEDDVAVLVRLGDRARLEGRFVEAEASYRAALKQRDDDAVWLSLALCLSAEGKARDAAPLLERLAAAATLGADARAQAALALADARRVLATIEVRASLPGAVIELDGAVAGRSPLLGRIYVDPGSHTARASLDGYITTQAMVDAGAGHAYLVDLGLVPDLTLIPRWTPPTPERKASLMDYMTGSDGILRGIGVGLAISLALGGATALAVAQQNEGLVDEHKDNYKARNLPGCFGKETPRSLLCDHVGETLSDAQTAHDAGVALLAGAGIAAAATALSFVFLPASHRRTASIRSTLTLTPTAGPTAGGLALEATW